MEENDKYYIRCFRKELQDYVDEAWGAYLRVYGHLYTRDQIVFAITRDVIKLLNKIDITGKYSISRVLKYAKT